MTGPGRVTGPGHVTAAGQGGGLLRQRNFRLLWTGETISGAGSSMAAVGVPLLAVTTLRASTFAVSALTAAAYLPWLVIGLPAGAWADRRPPRPLMIGCDVAAALLYASLPAAAWLGVLGTAQVVAVALLAGAVNVVFAPACQVYLPSLVSAAELTEGSAWLQGGASASAIAGRAVAGLAARALGAATALLFNAASFLVSAACLLRIPPPPAGQPPPPAAGQPPARQPPAPAAGKTARTRVWPGLALVARDPYLRPLTLYAAAANLAYTGNLALVVVFLIRVVRLGPAAASLLLAAGGAGGLLGALLAPRLTRAFGPGRALILTGLGAGLSGLLVPLAARGPRLACYLTGATVIAAGLAAGNVIAGSFRQQYCPPSLLGRVTAGMRFLAYGMIPLGAVAAGALGTALGARNALWVLQALFAAAALFLVASRVRAGLPLKQLQQREHLGRRRRDAAHV